MCEEDEVQSRDVDRLVFKDGFCGWVRTAVETCEISGGRTDVSHGSGRSIGSGSAGMSKLCDGESGWAASVGQWATKVRTGDRAFHAATAGAV